MVIIIMLKMTLQQLQLRQRIVIEIVNYIKAWIKDKNWKICFLKEEIMSHEMLKKIRNFNFAGGYEYKGG